VDRNQRIYRRAGGGRHVAFAAPGVEVWTAASVSGARGKTGTSFAAPFVSATIAIMRGQNPALTAAQARDILARDAIDLGPAGRDDVYGHGLLFAPAACAPARLTPVSN
jgi:subtilisin family serine protease